MRPQHITAAANLICKPIGAVCRYEFTLDCFRWNFYYGGRRVKSLKKWQSALAFAERFIKQLGEMK